MTVKSELPASVSAAWGLEDGVARRRPHGLSLERIVRAGLHLATAEGLPAVSMNRVARELIKSPRAAGSLLSPRTWRVVHAGQVLRRRAAAEHEATGLNR